MIKRPVFVMLLAFVLGEVIAVLNWDIIVVAMISLVFMFIIANKNL